MAGGRAGFLNELDGDFVKYLRSHSPIGDMLGGNDENARIYPSMPRQGQPAPYIVYTQVTGHSEKDLAGVEGCEDVVLHVYAYGDSQPESRSLARHIHDRMLPTQAIVGDGTKVHVCNGGITDDGADKAADSSDRKRFWTRLVLRMVISD